MLVLTLLIGYSHYPNKFPSHWGSAPRMCKFNFTIHCSGISGCAQHDLSEEQYWLMIAKASECAGDLNQKAQTHHFEKWLLWKERAFQREIFRANIKSI